MILRMSSREEREHQNMLEQVLLPDIVLPLGNPEAVERFVHEYLRKALGSDWYRLRYDQESISVTVERIDGYNIKSDEQYPGNPEHMPVDEMISAREVYERIVQCIQEFCGDAQLPDAPAFPDYELSPLSQHVELPVHQRDIRNRLMQLCTWDTLRSAPHSAFQSEELDHHLEEMQRHYNQFFNTRSQQQHVQTFHDWIIAIEPVLLKRINQEYSE